MLSAVLLRIARRRPPAAREPVAAGARAVRAALHALPDVRDELSPIERTGSMIKLHHGRDQREIWVNGDLVETVEATPDTVVTLSTGKKLIVAETPEEITALVVEFRRRVAARPQILPGSGSGRRMTMQDPVTTADDKG